MRRNCEKRSEEEEGEKVEDRQEGEEEEISAQIDPVVPIDSCAKQSLCKTKLSQLAAIPSHVFFKSNCKTTCTRLQHSIPTYRFTRRLGSSCPSCQHSTISQPLQYPVGFNLIKNQRQS